MMPHKILILAPYPLGKAASQRFRFEHFLKYFPEKNLNYTFQSFWSDAAWKILYKKGHLLSKFLFLVEGFIRRATIIFSVSKFDRVLVHRELTPIGPPVFEFLIAKVFSKKIIYDFDDAIWLSTTSGANKIISGLKQPGKIGLICRWSWKITAGNEFLARYASRYNSDVHVFPTVVETDRHHNKTKQHSEAERPVIGWTGTHSTSVYLKMLEEPLADLRKELDFVFLVISDQKPDVNINNTVFLPWSKIEEIGQLLKMDVGVMPLKDSPWEKGKCGFKLIQYLALGIPAVASPAGVNSEIIDHAENGFIAHTNEDWTNHLKLLLNDCSMRKRMGEKGRKKIQDKFSVASNLDRFFSFFE